MHARQHRLAVADIAQHHRKVFFAGGVFNEGVQGELGPRRRQGARRGVIQFFGGGGDGGNAHVVVILTIKALV